MSHKLQLDYNRISVYHSYLTQTFGSPRQAILQPCGGIEMNTYELNSWYFKQQSFLITLPSEMGNRPSKCMTTQVCYYWMLLPRAFLLLLNPLRYQRQLLCHASTQRKNHDLKLKNQQGRHSESNERQKLIPRHRVCMIAILLRSSCHKIIGCIVNSYFLSLPCQFCSISHYFCFSRQSHHHT